MLGRKIAWTLWAFLPVAGAAYHFGPGQRAYSEDRAADLLTQAEKLEHAAESAQSAAYASHLASLKLRKAGAATSEAAGELKAASAREDAAYASAADAWRAVSDKLQTAQDLLTAANSPKADAVRIAKDRALIRGGKIVEGVSDLEILLDTFAETGQEESPAARDAREEVATGYYYGARLMRVAGKSTAEWREVSGFARQNFRYLAETAAETSADAKASDLQKNLELVLNLEQSGQEDLLAKPLPKMSPRNVKEGLGTCKNPGKSKRPPRKGKDARGASGVGDIEGGW